MSTHLRIEIDKLKKQILSLSILVEESVQKSVVAIQKRNEKMAEEIIAKDTDIDIREVDLEEECLKILALHQPVASDLRFIISVLKINNDLERIGDLAVNIAERALYLSIHAPVTLAFDLPAMADKTLQMLRMSLEALVNTDSVLALQVLRLDEEVDAINRGMYGIVTEAIRRDSSHMETILHMLSVSRYLERIADHTTNIAEDVLYMLNGEIVRHRVEAKL